MILLPLLGGLVAAAQAALATALEWAVTSAIIGGLIGGGVGAGSEIISTVSAGEEIRVESVAESALHGAASGAIGGAASGAIIGAAVGGVGAAVNIAHSAHLAANARHLPATASGGFTYGIRHLSNPALVKIGVTGNPAQRLPHLIRNYGTQSSYAFLKYADEAKLAETAMHQAHRASNVTRGVKGIEWFALDDLALARSFSY